ncbi:MAG: zinc ribbon domain-containing protein [Chloroflexota bacterium]
MGSLLGQLGAVLGGIASQPAVRLTFAALGLYIVIVWLAAAYWVFRDLRRRTDNSVLPYVAAGGVIVASPLLFVFALLVYRIIRPASTLADRREAELEDRLARLDLASLLACPTCRTLVEEDWLACPRCRTKLASACADCGRSMGLNWQVCAWCAWEPARPVVVDVPQVAAMGTASDKQFQPHRAEAARA